ncbi:MAG: response regulator [Alphaproteobacteria bacterium]
MKNIHPSLNKILNDSNIDSSIDSNFLNQINNEFTKFDEQIKELNNYNKNKDEYWAGINHELRTPLNSILGMSDLLAETKLNNEQENWLSIIKNSSESLIEIINDVLDFSKLAAGKFNLNNLPFRLCCLIEEVVNMVAIKVKDKPVEILNKFPLDNKYQIIGDSGRIRQILVNIIGNAIKFTEKGHILIELEKLEILNNNEARIQISITDTGIGIDPSKLESIFGQFNQAEASTAANFGGTGLGLSISKKLAELMRGNITVTSEKGKGSKFVIDLTMPLIERKCKNFTDVSVPDFSQLRILVVEDYLYNRDLILHYLEPTNSQNTVIESATAALELIDNPSTEPFDIVLLDYSLDLINGLELGKKVRLLPRYNNTLLVMVTSFSDISSNFDKDILKNNGFNGLLLRPFHSWQLVKMLSILWQARNNTEEIGFITKDTIRKFEDDKDNISVNTDEKFDFSGINILVAEDVKVNQLLLSNIISKYQANINFVSNGVDALKMYQKEKFDIIFMDCHMPDKDGYETTQEIRAFENKNNKHTIIVALTADALEGDREKCIAAGMDEYISKPFKKEIVLNMIQKYKNKGFKK